MKEVIIIVLESIYDPEFPDTSHFHGSKKSENLSLVFGIRHQEVFHTIDRHRLPSQSLRKRSTIPRGEKGPYSILQCITIGPTRQHLPTQAQSGDKEDPTKVRNSNCSENHIENSREEASFNAPQDNRAIIVGRVKSIQHKQPFIPLFRRGTPPPQAPPAQGGPEKARCFPPFFGPSCLP
ncbi:hypothetical protein M9H77_08255 [Catharanthus roseus]|uniref:Uncharacterized protein n=1 Tax=Catharanthus roseus TaxID=4058 RepID=A0ACC0BXE0_CATRO|nr:hypothetical protein M9H77_08255 [Catharanthus roseus]